MQQASSFQQKVSDGAQSVTHYKKYWLLRNASVQSSTSAVTEDAKPSDAQASTFPAPCNFTSEPPIHFPGVRDFLPSSVRQFNHPDPGNGEELSAFGSGSSSVAMKFSRFPMYSCEAEHLHPANTQQYSQESSVLTNGSRVQPWISTHFMVPFQLGPSEMWGSSFQSAKPSAPEPLIDINKPPPSPTGSQDSVSVPPMPSPSHAYPDLSCSESPTGWEAVKGDMAPSESVSGGIPTVHEFLPLNPFSRQRPMQKPGAVRLEEGHREIRLANSRLLQLPCLSPLSADRSCQPTSATPSPPPWSAAAADPRNVQAKLREAAEALDIQTKSLGGSRAHGGQKRPRTLAAAAARVLPVRVPVTGQVAKQRHGRSDDDGEEDGEDRRFLEEEGEPDKDGQWKLPGGVAKSCLHCGTTKTPLWRNGPPGPKSLCNACGIRFNKIRAGKRKPTPREASMLLRYDRSNSVSGSGCVPESQSASISPRLSDAPRAADLPVATVHKSRTKFGCQRNVRVHQTEGMAACPDGREDDAADVHGMECGRLCSPAVGDCCETARRTEVPVVGGWREVDSPSSHEGAGNVRGIGALSACNDRLARGDGGKSAKKLRLSLERFPPLWVDVCREGGRAREDEDDSSSSEHESCLSEPAGTPPAASPRTPPSEGAVASADSARKGSGVGVHTAEGMTDHEAAVDDEMDVVVGAQLLMEIFHGVPVVC